jgi:uncharacterized protein (DUF3084 family)
MTDQSEVKTDIALIKKDIKQIERFFNKVDTVMSEMSDMTKSLAVQQQILEHFSSKIEDVEQRMLEHKKEDIKRTETLHTRLAQYRKSSKEDHKRLADESAKNRIERNKEIMCELAKLNGNLEKRMIKMSENIEEQDDRLRKLENLKWWFMGVVAVLTFIFQFSPDINILSFFS